LALSPERIDREAMASDPLNNILVGDVANVTRAQATAVRLCSLLPIPRTAMSTATRFLRHDPAEIEPWRETCGQIRCLIEEKDGAAGEVHYVQIEDAKLRYHGRTEEQQGLSWTHRLVRAAVAAPMAGAMK
jgi:hypothetical protein